MSFHNASIFEVCFDNEGFKGQIEKIRGIFEILLYYLIVFCDKVPETFW